MIASVTIDDRPVTLDLVSALDYDWLRGFWREEHNVPTGLRQLEGNPARFEHDKQAAYRRSVDRLNAYAGMRWMLIETWDRWDFTEESWQC